MSDHPDYPKLTNRERVLRAKAQVSARRGSSLVQVLGNVRGGLDYDDLDVAITELVAQTAFLMSAHDWSSDNLAVSSLEFRQGNYRRACDKLCDIALTCAFYNVVPIVDGEVVHQLYGESTLDDLSKRPDRADVEIKLASMLLPCVANCDPREMIQRIFRMYGC